MSFAARLLRWYDRHGRKDLPWQRARTPYGVWVSEVMLQQTQVATVIPYFERFVARFPDLRTLADAPLDAVLAHWSGLGYYSRARNLHRAAQRIRDEHGGAFPEHMDAVTALPGIGRSTAGAILAQALGRRHAILDGNVKRVLTRHRAIDGWPGRSAVERRLWDIAEAETPHARVADYTQAIMDLGATVCTRARPRCAECPVAGDCAAHRAGATSRFPAPKPRKALPVRQTRMLLVTNSDGEVWLEKRPSSGIWGGLWSLPELPTQATPEEWAVTFGTRIHALATWAPLRHTFSHFHLDITPLRLSVATPACVMEPDRGLWYKPELSNQLGLPAPVARLLKTLNKKEPDMTRMVHCVKLGKEAEGLERQPYPGELGKRIFENVSKEAWGMWLRQQTMLINEYRLSPINPKHREMLEGELEKFFFGAGSTKPEGYVPPKN